MHEKERDKTQGRNNNGVAELPQTCNQPNEREVRPVAREIIKGMVWWRGGGGESLVSISYENLFWEILC